MSETAEAIMDAAEERIRQAGYSGFSFREVAADIGVKSSSVHYHFPTKKKLAAAVARRYTDRFLDAVDQKQATGNDIVTAWRQVFRDALHRNGRICLCGAMGAVSHDLAGEVREEVKRFFVLGIETLTRGGWAATPPCGYLLPSRARCSPPTSSTIVRCSRAEQPLSYRPVFLGRHWQLFDINWHIVKIQPAAIPYNSRNGR
ncbi:TetR/AcrR family transcriptional regulator [Sinorhizobium terangae]|uniref:TetR/AcrR family transcriptional regulator n=1 Tax=Sinorhizobium terangae TaxID=110322 RepID=UPI0024B08825|nr:TetR/AcrR family transcriptional regulator [Sinorhizobium terangae]WFU51926.1 TetR/AcrR family transcriptional regulator [Sinorhizobium terangae]